MPEIGDLLSEEHERIVIHGQTVNITIRHLYNPEAYRKAMEYAKDCMIAHIRDMVFSKKSVFTSDQSTPSGSHRSA